MATERALQIVVSAKDEASAKIKSMTGKISDNLQTVSIGATVAGGAMTAFLASTVAGASGAQEAQAQLEHAVLQVSKANQEQLESTMALADALEAKGVLDGDNIKVGLAQLSTFGLSNDAVQGLAGSMADLAVNQFGVNASGDQLSQTANTMAKALQGQFGVLEKSGIRFTEAQQAMIMYGTEAEKVTTLNEGLAQNLKYTNEVALGTFAGQMAHLKVQMENVSEAIGGALIPIIAQFASALLPVVQSILAWTTNNPQLFSGIVAVTGGLAVLLTGMGALGVILPAITAGFTFLGAVLGLIFSPIGLIVAGIAGLTAGLVYLYNTNETVRNAINEAWTTIQAVAGTAIVFLSNLVTQHSGTIKTVWIEAMEGMKTASEGTMVWLTGTFIPEVQIFIESLKYAFEPVVPFFQDHWAQVTSIFDFALSFISAQFSLAWNGMKTTLMVTFEIMKGIITTGLQVLTLNWSGAWETIKTTFSKVWDLMKEYVVTAMDALGNIVSTGSTAISSIFLSFGIDIGKTWSDLWEGIKQTVKGAVDMIESLITNMMGMINSAIEGAKNLAGSAVSMASFGTVKLGKRATGGTVSAGSPYIVGERRPELFVPDQRGTILPDARGAGGGAVHNIYITGNTFLDESSAEKIGDMFFNQYRLNMRT